MLISAIWYSDDGLFYQVQIISLDEETSEFSAKSTFDHPYPTTKIMWIPDSKGVYPDLLATSGKWNNKFFIVYYRWSIVANILRTISWLRELQQQEKEPAQTAITLFQLLFDLKMLILCLKECSYTKS